MRVSQFAPPRRLPPTAAGLFQFQLTAVKSPISVHASELCNPTDGATVDFGDLRRDVSVTNEEHPSWVRRAPKTGFLNGSRIRLLHHFTQNFTRQGNGRSGAYVAHEDQRSRTSGSSLPCAAREEPRGLAAIAMIANQTKTEKILLELWRRNDPIEVSLRANDRRRRLAEQRCRCKPIFSE